jgi:two-component system LytT family response regulator
MHTCIIVDDELPGRTGLSKLIEKYFKDRLKVLDLADSVENAIISIQQVKPKIVFLDIEMPGQNGFKLFELIPDQDFYVIFTTAYREYAIDAFKVSAFDYLLKPISRDELTATLNRLDSLDHRIPLKSQLNDLIHQKANGHKNGDKIAIPIQNGYRMVDEKDIIYCEADENYTKIYFATEECILIAKTLLRIEEMLPTEHFFRIHKSFLVNLRHIKTYDRRDGFSVTLSNDKILPIAFRRNEDFLKALKSR